jgi:peptidoglycan/xylan/chitin deacetylase (PgdA/CDA1 family)
MITLRPSTHLKQRSEKCFSPAERTGLLAFAAALILGTVDLRLATVPLTLFLMLCAMAPFFPRAGFFFPVISCGQTAMPVVALTFDDGPDPATTPLLLDLLDKYRITATFFVTGRRARQYPHLIQQIVARGHDVGNHSFDHNNYNMFWQPALLAHEISATQQALAPLGIIPVAFRPPVGITTPAMGKILDRQGLYAVNFSCRAFDRGNRKISQLSRDILSRIKPDDIVLLHDSKPGGNSRIAFWIDQVDQILLGLSKRGLTVISLSSLIHRPVMHRV